MKTLQQKDRSSFTPYTPDQRRWRSCPGRIRRRWCLWRSPVRTDGSPPATGPSTGTSRHPSSEWPEARRTRPEATWDTTDTRQPRNWPQTHAGHGWHSLSEDEGDQVTHVHGLWGRPAARVQIEGLLLLVRVQDLMHVPAHQNMSYDHHPKFRKTPFILWTIIINTRKIFLENVSIKLLYYYFLLVFYTHYRTVLLCVFIYIL